MIHQEPSCHPDVTDSILRSIAIEFIRRSGGNAMKLSVLVPKNSVLLGITLSLSFASAHAQDTCTQLRQGLREIDNERAKLCSEYYGTCAFLETAEKQLNACVGDECMGDLAIMIGGCAIVIGWNHCSYVGDSFSDFKNSRDRIENIARQYNCVLF